MPYILLLDIVIIKENKKVKNMDNKYTDENIWRMII